MTTNTEGAALKACPFCGSPATVRSTSGSDERNGYNFSALATCGTCFATVSVSSNYDKAGWCNEYPASAKARAVSAWNTRAPSSQPQEGLKQNECVIRKEVLRCLLEHAINGRALTICEPENTYIREAYAALKSPPAAQIAECGTCHGQLRIPGVSAPLIDCPDCAPPPSPAKIDCPACDGSGRLGYENPKIAGGSTTCPMCKGHKKVAAPPSPASVFTEPFQDTGAPLSDLVHRSTASEPAEKVCDSCGGDTGFMMNRGTLDVCDDPFHEQPSSEKGEAETREVGELPWPEDAALLRHSLDHNESREGFVMIERELVARVMNTLRASPAACEGRGSVTDDDLVSIWIAATPLMERGEFHIYKGGLILTRAQCVEHANRLLSLVARLTPAVAKE